MVRPKRQLAPEKKAEVENLLHETKEKFKMDLRELEMAKRQFSTAFVGAMATELPKIFPKEVLDMRLNDFIKQLDDQAYDFNDEPDQEGTSKGTTATPAFPRRPLTYKTMRTPAGLSIKVPSCITPKVEGSMARTGKRGEVLFSVHGTPVMNTAGADNTEAVVQDSNAETRRLLRHQMSTLCKDDIFCASCILPCRESLYEYDLCSHTLCRDTPDPTHCRESCVFLEQIASKKSGHCPPQKPLVPVSECSAFCDVDSDCAEIDKCCVVGCSRSCLTPSLNDSRLLPRPEGITVNERKRKRSAILRWVMKRLSPQHTATNSNLFVIQWRWSVHKLSETMAPWQTIMVRNKMYAILKHLLSPGRFYVFRVAAVNMHGTHGFSQPSHPSFKLSTELKAPSAPLNVTFIYESWRPPKIVWNPPNSEVPLKEYRLSWWRTSDELAKAFELRQRRHSNQKNTADDDYEGLLGEEIDGDEFGLKRSIVLPSYSTKAELAGLEPGHFYIAELYASVESSEGDLRGDPAVLLIRMPNKTEATKMPDPFNDDAEIVQNKMNLSASKQLQVEVKTPYFEDGRLKTIISWLSALL
uniref:Fibronectin type-III domain-containing protein n=1 Tax=Globodera pallida TaxID=36090 RepID=A0A183BJU0_GLOPA